MSKAQTATIDPRSYVNNLVDIGLSDFGLITGEDSTHIYFICIRHVATEAVTTSLKAPKFFNYTVKQKAVKVSSVRFGAYAVVLYQAAKPENSEWQNKYYSTLAYKKGKLATFRDHWLSDKIWSIHDAKITVLKQPKDGLVTLKVPRDAGIAKGMPLINSDGFIAGVVAESSLGKTMVKAINMKEIANAFYGVDSTCHFFNMIEWGQHENHCEIAARLKSEAELKAKLEAEKKIKPVSVPEEKKAVDTVLAKKHEPKHHFIDYGLNLNYLQGPSQFNNAEKDYESITRTLHAGISVYLNIDKNGRNRLTLKPRYGSFKERNDPGIWSSPDDNFKITRTSYEYVEMPVVFERQLFHTNKYSMAIGAGYSGGYVFSQNYMLLDKASSVATDNSVDFSGTSSIHRLVGELYFYEFKFGRLGAVYTRDLTAYPNAKQVVNVNGTDYTPFAARKKAWYLGVEIAIRLRGTWVQPRK
ncbi:MAG TPA: hypothetical protein VK644_12335 [Chitinophagaceae bacterium]|nr:hypothetical protein [Chitinophagaceae bacterium]